MVLTSVDDAVNQLLGLAKPTMREGELELDLALGGVCAENISSEIDVPAFDNSAMDGYAGCWEDITVGQEYEVSDRIAAGKSPGPLVKGSLARIFTGAPLPEGADTVIIQEHVGLSGNLALVHRRPDQFSNIRKRGHDIKSGSIVISKGEFLSSTAIALLGSIGREKVRVKKPLVVSIFSTGDELVLPGNPLEPGQIYNSNRFLVYGLLKQMGMEVLDLGIVPDKVSETVEVLSEASEKSDLIISSGGVSVGEEDHVKSAVEAIGSINMWKVAMKPGKPVAFGTIKTKPFLGLPGNPVSTFVSFCVFVKPFLKAMQGFNEVQGKEYVALSSFDFHGSSRREYLRARYRIEKGKILVDKYENQGSSILSSVYWANSLAIVDPGEKIEIGDQIKILILD